MTILITGLDQPIGQYVLELCLGTAAKVRVAMPPGMPAPRPHRNGFERVVGALGDNRTLAAAVRDILRANDLLVTMGAGNMNVVSHALPAQLARLSPVPSTRRRSS